MKKMKKRKLLIVLLIIVLFAGQIGLNNLLSYAQNLNTGKEVATILDDALSVKFSTKDSKYVFIVGDTTSIKADVTSDSTGLITTGEHPDKFEYQWFKEKKGARPSPFIDIENQNTETLTLKAEEPTKVGEPLKCALRVYVLRWNAEGGESGQGAYERVQEELYGKNYDRTFYSNQIEINILPKLEVDLTDQDSKIQGSKESGYTLELSPNSTYKLDLDLYRLQANETRMPFERVSKIEWSSANKDIVSVTQDGYLTAKGYSDEGIKITAKVTDLNSDEKEISVKVIVKKIKVSKVTINESNVELKVNEEKTLTATVEPDTASEPIVTWKIVENSPSDIIDINSETGVITGKKIGDTKVIATADGVDSEPLTIKVVETPVESITDELKDTNIILVANSQDSKEYSLTIHPEVLPKDATDKTITWNISEDKKDFVEIRQNRDGSVSFIALKYDETNEENNKCEITATSNNGKTRTYNITLTKKVNPVTDIFITTKKDGQDVDLPLAAVIELFVGETVDLDFRVSPSDATYKDDLWTASQKIDMNPVATDVISVDNAGVVTAQKEGTAYARIRVTCHNPKCPSHSKYVTIKVKNIPPTPVDNVVINEGETVHVRKLEKTTLTATVTPDDATDKTVTWSSNAPAIAEVNSSTGEVTAKAKGTAVITATTSNGKTDTCTVIVDPISVEYIEISNITLTIKDNIIVGDKKLSVTYYPESADDKGVTWKSSNESVVEVREDGTLVPKKVGTSIVTATLNSDSEKFVACEVTVVPSKAQVVIYTVDQHTNFISGLTLRITGKDENGVEITPKELTANGKFDFGELPDGDYTIETILPKTRTVSLASELNIIDYVKISTFKIKNGEILYANIETSESQAEYAESLVLVNIVDYPDETGEEELTAIMGAGENYSSGEKTIEKLYEEYAEVKEIPVESITDELENTEIELVANSEGSKEYFLTIHPEVLPKDATNKEITWTSSKEGLVEIRQNEDGSVSFIALKYDENNEENNKCVITASSNNGKTREYYITIIKEKIDVQDVKITIDGMTTIEEPYKLQIGKTVDLNFEVIPKNATYKQDSWSFDPEVGSPADVVSVDNSGVVTAKAVGKAYVNVKVACQNKKCPTHTAKILIEVVPIPVDGIEIELEKTQGEKTLTLQKGSTKNLTAKVTPENATDKTITWESSNTNVVTVDNEGNVTAVGPGEATIKARAGEKEDSCKIIVPEIKVRSIELSSEKLTIKDNEEHTLTFKYSPDNADNAEFEWESSDSEIAEVKDGKITPKKAGKTIIKVYVKNDPTVYATCELTITPSQTEVNPGEEEDNPPEVNPGEGEDNPSEVNPGEGENNPSEGKPDDGDNTATNNPEKNDNVTPTTSDIPIVAYIVLMIASLIAITFIIVKKNKKTKSKRRYK